MAVSKTSAWDTAGIQAFLKDTTIPIRLAVMDDGYPLICSLWFAWDDGDLVCVSHRNSKLTRLLQKAGRCGFEIAANQPPYHGVRGKADVKVIDNKPEHQLRQLIDKHLGDTNQRLGRWLLSRIDDEYELRLTPTWLTAWDYGNRMDPPARAAT